MKRLLFSLVFATLLVVPSSVLAGFGVSPAKIVEDRLVKGSVFERTIYFVQGAPEKDLPITINIDDSPIKTWITSEPSGTVVIPKGVQQFPVKIIVRVPQDAELGIYKTFVRASANTIDPSVKASGGNGVSVSMGAVAALELTVGTGLHYEYGIRNIDIKNIREIDDINVDINIENKGNVIAGPNSATFELFNQFGDVRLGYVQGIKVEQVPPFEVKNVNVKFPMSIRLSPGEYWGLVKFYQDGGQFVREHKGIFVVTKATFIDKYGLIIIIIGGALLALIIIILLWRKLGRSRSYRASR